MQRSKRSRPSWPIAAMCRLRMSSRGTGRRILRLRSCRGQWRWMSPASTWIVVTTTQRRRVWLRICRIKLWLWRQWRWRFRAATKNGWSSTRRLWLWSLLRSARSCCRNSFLRLRRCSSSSKVRMSTRWLDWPTNGTQLRLWRCRSST